MLMKIIHKHKLSCQGELVTLRLPADCVLRTVEYLSQEKEVFLWVEVPARINPDLEERSFRIFKTGDGIPEAHQYIGTAIDQYIPEAYHVYEKTVHEKTLTEQKK